MKIIFDRYRNSKYEIKTIPFTNFGDLENYIIRLDQTEFSEVILKDKNNELRISGGRYNFLISIKVDGETFDLINSNQNNFQEQIPVMIKGQSFIFSPNLIVNFEKALVASKYFCQHKGIERSLYWKKRFT